MKYNLGLFLRIARITTGINQKEAAKHFGISEAYLSGIECKNKLPPAKTLILAKELYKIGDDNWNTIQALVMANLETRYWGEENG